MTLFVGAPPRVTRKVEVVLSVALDDDAVICKVELLNTGWKSVSLPQRPVRVEIRGQNGKMGLVWETVQIPPRVIGGPNATVQDPATHIKIPMLTMGHNEGLIKIVKFNKNI